MLRLQIVFKGPKYDIVLTGDRIEEIEREYKSVRNRIEKLIGKVPSEKPAKVTKTGVKSILLDFRSHGFFKKPRDLREIQHELAGRGYTKPVSSLTAPLLDLVRDGSLARKQEKRGKKTVWIYFTR